MLFLKAAKSVEFDVKDEAIDIGLVISLVGSGAMTTSYRYFGLFLNWLMLFLICWSSKVEVRTFILNGLIRIIFYRAFTISKLLTISRKVIFIITPKDKSVVLNYSV